MSDSSRRARTLRRFAVPTVVAASAVMLASCAGGDADASDAAGEQELTVLLISSHEGASDLLAERYEAETARSAASQSADTTRAGACRSPPSSCTRAPSIPIRKKAVKRRCTGAS